MLVLGLCVLPPTPPPAPPTSKFVDQELVEELKLPNELNKMGRKRFDDDDVSKNNNLNFATGIHLLEEDITTELFYLLKNIRAADNVTDFCPHSVKGDSPPM